LTAAGAARKIAGMSHPAPLSLYALARSLPVVAGVLLLGVGIGNAVVGHTKVAQYERVLSITVAPTRSDSAVLFPKATEAGERREIARVKLRFYERLLTAGQCLLAVGFALLAGGILRLQVRAHRGVQELPSSN
jgi:hypothetical protein